MKDIFIDTNVAKHLANPLTDEYKELVKWLVNDGALVMSDYLLAEYGKGNQNLSVIISRLQATGRLNSLSKQQINGLRFTKKIERRLESNRKDWNHIKAILLSKRKIAIALDIKLMGDINTYPKIEGIQPTCVNCPTKVNYK